MKYHQVLLMYHIESRDKVIFDLMADLLIRNGVAKQAECVYTETAFRYPYNYNPDLVITVFPRDDRASALFTMLKVAWQCYWIVYSVEAFVKLDEENLTSLIGYNSCPKELVDMYLLCGPGVALSIKDLLIRRGRADKNSRFEYFGYLFYEKEMIRRIEGNFEDSTSAHQDSNKYEKRLLFATAIMNYPMKVEERLGESTIRNNQKELIDKYQKLCDYENYYAEMYIETICKLAKNHPEYMVMIKLHPVEKYYKSYGGQSRYQRFDDFPNIYIIDGDVQISHYFDITDVFLHYGSTTSVEAYIYGIRTIGIDSWKKSPFSKSLYGNSIVKIEDFARLEDEISRDDCFERNAEIEEVLLSLFNYTYGGVYNPSKDFVEIISKQKNPRIINKSCEGVRKKLSYRSCLKKYVEYNVDAIKWLFQGERKKYKCIKKFLRGVTR